MKTKARSSKFAKAVKSRQFQVEAHTGAPRSRRTRSRNLKLGARQSLEQTAKTKSGSLKVVGAVKAR